jgi:hypothetical protein
MYATNKKNCHFAGVDGNEHKVAAVGANSGMYDFYSSITYDTVMNKMMDETNIYSINILLESTDITKHFGHQY